MDNNPEDKEALDILSNLEESGDVKFDKEEKKVTSLGKASRQFMSDAGESPWKLVALNTLPSKGMMHDVEFEQLIKSAKTKEIRHTHQSSSINTIARTDNSTTTLAYIHLCGIWTNCKHTTSQPRVRIDQYYSMYSVSSQISVSEIFV